MVRLQVKCLQRLATRSRRWRQGGPAARRCRIGHAVERFVVDDEDGCLSRDQVKSCSAARSAPATRAYSSSIRGSSSAAAMSVPAFAITSSSRQNSASLVAPNTFPVGSERVRHPTQLLRVARPRARLAASRAAWAPPTGRCRQA
jgi:hypothetical protein